MALALAPSAAAGSVRILATDPPAPRGGVLMVPVAPLPASARAGAGMQREATPRVVDATGRALPALMVAVGSREDAWRTRVSWTRDPAGPAVRHASREAPVDGSVVDGSAVGGSAADAWAWFLLIDLEGAAEGALLVDDVPLPVWWLDAPSPSVPDPFGLPPTGVLEIAQDAARPDPSSPFEHWRWILLAEESGREPPPADRFVDPAERLMAQAMADRWRMALGRVASVDASAARACRHQLTRLARDGDREIAAWITDPDQLTALLTRLMDRGRTGRRLAEDALAWSESMPPFLAWTVAETPEATAFVVLNRSIRDLALEVRRDERGATPHPLQVAPGRLVRAALPRTPDDPADVLLAARRPTSREPRHSTMSLTGHGHTLRLPTTDGVLRIVPPHGRFPVALPPLTLTEAAQGARRAPDARRRTDAHLRRREGRWELFVTCARPALGAADDAPPGERIVVTFGPPDAPVARLHVPEQGWPVVQPGTNDGTLQVHRRSHGDLWVARIVIPAAWIAIHDQAPWPALAVTRHHGDGDQVEHTPGAWLPWESPSAALFVDLVEWDELP